MAQTGGGNESKAEQPNSSSDIEKEPAEKNCEAQAPDIV
jgi:hypothetical protein